jgi:hypothetical protein
MADTETLPTPADALDLSAPAIVKRLPRATVIIGTPSGGMVNDEFNETMFRMQAAMHGHGVRLIPARCSGSHLSHNQNNILKAARDVNKKLVDAGDPPVDAIFFYETDEGIRDPEDAIARLVDHNVDIVGATYCFKKPDRIEVMGVELDGTPIDWLSLYTRPELSEVAGLPIGALLIRMNVFDVIEHQCIPDWAKEYGRLPAFYSDIAATGEGPIPRTSDYTFCSRSRTCGFKIWLDARLSLQIDHYGAYPYRLPQPHEMSADVAMLAEIAASYRQASQQPGAQPHYVIWAERVDAICAHLARKCGLFAQPEKDPA